MSLPLLEILYEDNHLLAVNKPAGLPTMGVAASESSLVALARSYLKVKYHKPGNVYLGVVSRLDALATGVVLLVHLQGSGPAEPSVSGARCRQGLLGPCQPTTATGGRRMGRLAL